MGQFYLSWNNAPTSISPMTMGKLMGVSLRRYEVIEIIGTGAGRANPADIQHEAWGSFLSNVTTGTATVIIPGRMDQAANSSNFFAHIEHTVEPTTYATSNDTLFGFNQRGGMRWAVPEGYGYKSDGGQTNLSFGARIISSSVGAVDGRMAWVEP
jgi:hypothetical protein